MSNQEQNANAATVDAAQMLAAMNALKNGDLSYRLPEAEGVAGEIAQAFNAHMQQMSDLMSEMLRLSREIGTEARFGGQAEGSELRGIWGDFLTEFNLMSGNLTNQIRDLGNVVQSELNGDHSKQVTVGAQGEMAALKNALNTLLTRTRTSANSN